MGFIGNVIDGIGNAWGQLKAAINGDQYSFNKNKEMARYQYDLQNEQIRAQNEYNSPVQQMARYQEAGLNPNLIYGSGSASAGNQSGIAQYNAPQMSRPGKIDGMSTLNQILQFAQNAKLFKLNVDKQERENYNQSLINRNQEMENAWLQYRLYGENAPWLLSEFTAVDNSPFAKAFKKSLNLQDKQIAKYSEDTSRIMADTAIKQFLLTGKLPDGVSFPEGEGSTYWLQRQDLKRKNNLYNTLDGLEKPEKMSDGLWEFIKSVGYSIISGSGD